MSSRLRESSMNESSRVATYAKEQLHEEQQDQPLKSFKNGSNRYHFGMARQRNDESSRNGRDCLDHSDDDADLLYKKSKEHFGAWDIKDIVQDESLGPRKQAERFEDSRLTNGRSKSDFSRQDRRDDRGRIGSVDREQSYRSRKKDAWQGTDSKAPKSSRSRNAEGKEESQRTDDRDLLLREIESLAVDGRSPDRRIRAMIERFKTREEDKLKSRRERDSLSPEREEHGSRSAGDDRVNDRDRAREDERKLARSKIREPEKLEREEVNRSRSIDRRSEKFNDLFADKHEESKRSDSFKLKNDVYGVEKSHRRRSRELEDDLPRRKDSPKRRSYAYEGNPEDFDVRIQRYERALLEPRSDLDCLRRVPLKDSESDLTRKESFKDHDRQVSRKSSFKSGDPRKSRSRDRDSSLSRKASSKNEERDLYRKNSFKGQDAEKKYFGKDPEHVSRKSSFKEHEAGRKNSLKEQSSDYGRISSRSRDDEEDRKNSFKGHAGGISRITFKEQDGGSTRVHSHKDQELEVGRVSFKDHSNDLGRKNSFKEKTVEFAGISYKAFDDEDDDHVDRRAAYKVQDSEPSKASFQSIDDHNCKKRHSPNGRYVEFGTVSFQTEDDEPRASSSNDKDHDLERKNSFKERDSSKKRSSPRSKSQEALEKRSNRHSRPLTPPKRGEAEYREDSKDREDFNATSWHDSNRVFAVKYLRENSRYRSNPEGRSEVERDPSPEMGVEEFRDGRYSNEGFAVEMEDDKREQRSSNHSAAESYSFGCVEEAQDTRYAATRERNGATIIRIRSSPETTAERRRRRRPAQDTHAARRRRHGEAGDEEDTEDEEEDDRRGQRSSRADGSVPGRGVPTPSRRVWNYREGVWHFHESIAFDQSFMVQKREAIFINRWRR